MGTLLTTVIVHALMCPFLALPLLSNYRHPQFWLLSVHLSQHHSRQLFIVQQCHKSTRTQAIQDVRSTSINTKMFAVKSLHLEIGKTESIH
jgi:hypothetical protein